MALVLGTNSGFVTTAPTADPAGTGVTIDGSSVVTKHTSPAGATKIVSIGWYRESGTNAANFEVALYSDVAGVPVSRLFVDNTNSTASNGWVTVAVDWAISANTAYWLAVQMDAHSGSSGIDTAASGGAGYDVMTSQTTLNDPYGGGLLADADGMAAIYALLESPVTGTGAAAAQSAAASGSGVSSSAGTGASVAQAATGSGAGVSSSVGLGALAAQSAAVSGSGTVADSAVTGSGAPVAQSAAASGVGVSASAGAGAATVDAATAAGVGFSASIGDGAPACGAASVAGVGTVGAAAQPQPVAETSGGSGIVRRRWPRRFSALGVPPEALPVAGLGSVAAGSALVSGAGMLGLTRTEKTRRILRIL